MFEGASDVGHARSVAHNDDAPNDATRQAQPFEDPPHHLALDCEGNEDAEGHGEQADRWRSDRAGQVLDEDEPHEPQRDRAGEAAQFAGPAGQQAGAVQTAVGEEEGQGEQAADEDPAVVVQSGCAPEPARRAASDRTVEATTKSAVISRCLRIESRRGGRRDGAATVTRRPATGRSPSSWSPA